MSSSGDDSTSDEEYIPPLKASKLEEDSESEYSDASENSDCGDVSSTTRLKRNVFVKRNSEHKSKISDTSPATTEEKKAHEDKVWEEFLKLDNNKKSDSMEKINVVKKYQFAGEEVEITQAVSRTADTTRHPDSIRSQNNTSTETKLLKPKAPSVGLGLSNALQNLKSTISNLPKLSTLEKSRLDWKQYIQKESLEDDLKAHNKGKEGYLERQAFFNRASEREYQYERELKKSTSNRRA
uniref:Craniofacial development protein 1 n=1 Tax=Schistosoma japonicum TaxID=6182 RepID=Q5DC09_SCHJA|nr:SJCHGC01833 protein [Schistosoma japonicum]